MQPPFVVFALPGRPRPATVSPFFFSLFTFHFLRFTILSRPRHRRPALHALQRRARHSPFMGLAVTTGRTDTLAGRSGCDRTSHTSPSSASRATQPSSRTTAHSRSSRHENLLLPQTSARSIRCFLFLSALYTYKIKTVLTPVKKKERPPGNFLPDGRFCCTTTREIFFRGELSQPLFFEPAEQKQSSDDEQRNDEPVTDSKNPG